MIGYHGTPNDFEAFSEDFLGSNGMNSPNGRLGVWFYTDPELAKLHGGRVLAIEADIRMAYDMTVRQLREISVSGDTHERLDEARASLLRRGYDAIRIVEMDGQSLIGIILDLKRIVSVTEFSQQAPSP